MERNYKYEYICESNGNIRATINRLKDLGYKYIVKATDKWLSGWSGTVTENKKHIHLIACYDVKELNAILADVNGDNTFNYVDWNYINNYSNIYAWTRGKSYTIRNDWTRAFK